MRKLTFIIGGARSGKSAYAQKIAGESEGSVLFVATAQPLDDEMRRRIEQHRQNRSPDWQTLELPANVGRRLLAQRAAADVLVLDCITLLISNVLLQTSPDLDAPDEAAARGAAEAEVDGLLKAHAELGGHWVVVSNEVGQGVVPAYPAGRLFRDLLGWVNQRMAAEADEVIWMVAGIPVPIGEWRKQN